MYHIITKSTPDKTIFPVEMIEISNIEAESENVLVMGQFLSF